MTNLIDLIPETSPASKPNNDIESNLIEGFKNDSFLSSLKDNIENQKSRARVVHPNEYKALASALRASGMSYRKIGFVLGVSNSTVHDWVNRSTITGVAADRCKELADNVKSNLANKQYLLSNSILSAISDEDIARASLKDKVISSSIMIDKARLIDGESTENQSLYIRKSVEINSKITIEKEAIKKLDEEIALLESEIG